MKIPVFEGIVIFGKVVYNKDNILGEVHYEHL